MNKFKPLIPGQKNNIAESNLDSVALKPPTAAAPWVDPEVSRLVSQWPPECWPVTLYADDGQTPVVFDSADELRAATK